jgi:hypothetical protein
VPLSCHTRNGVHGVRRPTNESEHTADVRVPRIAAAAPLCEACASQTGRELQKQRGLRGFSRSPHAGRLSYASVITMGAFQFEFTQDCIAEAMQIECQFMLALPRTYISLVEVVQSIRQVTRGT